MLNLPRRQSTQQSDRYGSLGLTDLPFPTEPIVNTGSQDPRRNGGIYAQWRVGGCKSSVTA